MKKILIVEDELAYITLLSEKLSHEYQVLSASNGKEGLQVATKEHPDLILCDISMPVMDGMSMLKELRKDDFGAKVKVIMLTNLEPTEDILKSAVAGQPTSYVIKSDTSFSELITKIKETLSE